MDIVIVDDDKMVRFGIRESIDWAAYDLCVAGEAPNGKAGLELIRRLRPQIAIIDVKMPVMDGLELTRILSETLPEVKVLILSGYSEFDYARQAMRLGVRNYLLKPVRADELIEAVTRLRDECRETVANQPGSGRREAELDAERRAERERMLMDAVSGQAEFSEDFIERAKRAGLRFDQGRCAVLIIDMGERAGTTEERWQWRMSSERAFHEAFDADFHAGTFFTSQGHLCALLNLTDRNDGLLIRSCISFQRRAEDELGLRPTICIGEEANLPEEIPEAYTTAMTAQLTAFCIGQQRIVDMRAVERIDDGVNAMPDLNRRQQELLRDIHAQDAESLEQTLREVSEEIIRRRLEPNQAKGVFAVLALRTLNTLEGDGIRFFDVLGSNADRLYALYACRRAAELNEWAQEFFARLMGRLAELQTNTYGKIVSDAMRYVAQNYQTEIRVCDVADIVHVTPNHFSRVFAQETGMRFSDYLNKFRIDKAKQLLRAGERVTETAERCGYSDAKYFGYVFSKYEGCPPKRYAELQGAALPAEGRSHD